MQYQEFLDHIYQRYSGNVKLELGRMEGLLKDMGSPQDALKGFHVAGTNGKGSVCATLEALCLAHSMRTGLNTSPHLINYTERFRIDGHEVSIDAIMQEFHQHEELFNKWDASFFEITTAIAFSLFSKARLDIAVMEVGLGGRLDATNLFTPDVAVITTIGLDHIKTLGGTVELIAAEKAGIIKEALPLVLGDIEESPLRIITEAAKAKSAPCYMYGRDWRVSIREDNTAGISFDYLFGGFVFCSLKSNLMGEHQAVNLGAAITAYILYCQKHQLPIMEDTIRKGLASINWAGRMQVLSQKPMIIVDGAHNVHGVKALVRTLEKVFPHQKLIFVISILADKDYSEMIHLFCSKADRIFVAQNQSDRAATAEAQVQAVQKYGAEATSCESVAAALTEALKVAGKDGVIVAGGSLYTVGEVISAFRAYA
ncbi:MAG: bifunctional folylpolyglutamate synthase/dihydrofolate synthase [Candidatus Cloacimonetes bacterium]|jgi:dihydrofolate synthase/folylpolyglutamate synthase|nr:bifunctional folylpolyglutamate synthase/dihydrofolate synthase [Candidatus Cloacimonadota bacterium]MDY0337615.1 folylpolyglutamate synthase/dihydrofolate synthase family protein [Candidatus Cloacimonadaceae bacterium]MCB5269535.1 bifunctional folylpolyglutamate synthase/dihydrofolate synthase [Candidatus Cloacimonadota bacterium]MCK9334116.1 bifunctional folylpolyglutamate synthase/dihydrofolate synthase [Candidatus Cloacimonadota bacterium]MDD2682855.1 bifunctional folylpolyglutamate synt